MDNNIRNTNYNPRDKANIFSVLTWSWTVNLFRKGYSKILGIEDLYDPVSKDKSNVLGDLLEKEWFVELERAKRKNRNPNFLYAIFRTFALDIFSLGLIHVINEMFLRLATPFLLGAFLRYFKPESKTSFETAVYYTASLLTATFVSTMLLNQTIFIGYHLGGRARIAACSVIYRKALRLRKTALGETAPGKIVNLLASDVSRFELVFTQLHYMWSAPLLAIIITILIYQDIGWSAIVGMSIVFSIILFQGYLGQLTSKYRLATSLKTDERVRLMDEIISGIRVIKMHAWEKSFCALVELARQLELKIVEKSSYISGIYMTFFLFTTRMALYGTIMTMLLRGQQLTAEKIFVYISYFNTIAITMSIMFVRGIVQIADCNVAINRIQCFLMHEEFESKNSSDDNSETTTSKTGDTEISSNIEDIVNKPNGNLVEKMIVQTNGDSTDELNKREYSGKYKDVPINKRCSIKLNNVTAKWNSHSAETIFKDITLEIEKGKLYYVMGLVGAGKSSLMSAILGELKLFQGSVDVKGHISYADQDAWVFCASVKENILFGQKFDEQRYEKVVKACDLQKDFEQFPFGDQTIVGERGRTLSGGQKARINLARAVYREADIYLLDDPLSAVDSHVGKHLFEKCLQKYLIGKTRILATHQLQYIDKADGILLLDQGKIHQFANHYELSQADPKYSSLIGAPEGRESIEGTFQHFYSSEQKFSSISTRHRVSESYTEINGTENNNETKQTAFFESTSRGTVKGSLFLTYLRSGASGTVVLMMLVLYLATQASVSLNDYLIPVLINHHQNDYNSLPLIQNISEGFLKEKDISVRNYYIDIYTGLVASIFLLGMTRSFVFYKMCLRASQRLHNLALDALIRAKMMFYDNNPSGRILNRFSKDLGVIDELLPRAIHDASQCIITAVGAIIVTCTINVWFLIPIVPIGLLFILIRNIHLRTSKNIKRLEGITRSPVFTHLNATLNGITTIRAHKAENILKDEFDKLQDTHTSSWYMFLATTIAFGFSLDVCCFLFMSVVTLSFLLLEKNFNEEIVGLAITQLMSLTSVLQWGMRQSAEVTNQLTSVERVLEYSQLTPEPNLRDKGLLAKKFERLKKEKQQENLLIKPLEVWPSKGCIKFINVFMRYTGGDAPVLKNLTFTIRPTEKVGVVGRTGAGKSSLISALFRLAQVEGVIEIDGFNTSTVALENLRKHISTILQDPVLFSGTLRRNLDPFNEFSDRHLWEVLKEVELKESVKQTGNGLDHRVIDRGTNYSIGQRQLICLARAILRNNRILILDEATANVDPHTDALIQRTICTKFASCTVLTVAHRLNTIMDSDKVLVMDKGQLVEFDHPYLLLQNQNGVFSNLVKESGRKLYKKLYRVAHNSYVDKFDDTKL